MTEETGSMQTNLMHPFIMTFVCVVAFLKRKSKMSESKYVHKSRMTFVI